MVAYLVMLEHDIAGGAMYEALHTFIYNSGTLSGFSLFEFALAHKRLRSLGLLMLGSCLASKQAENDHRVCLICTVHCSEHEIKEIH